MCKIDIAYCGGPDMQEHIEQMIAGLESLDIFDDEDDEDTRGEADMHEMARH